MPLIPSNPATHRNFSLTAQLTRSQHLTQPSSSLLHLSSISPPETLWETIMHYEEVLKERLRSDDVYNECRSEVPFHVVFHSFCHSFTSMKIKL